MFRKMQPTVTRLHGKISRSKTIPPQKKVANPYFFVMKLAAIETLAIDAVSCYNVEKKNPPRVKYADKGETICRYAVISVSANWK